MAANKFVEETMKFWTSYGWAILAIAIIASLLWVIAHPNQSEATAEANAVMQKGLLKYFPNIDNCTLWNANTLTFFCHATYEGMPNLWIKVDCTKLTNNTGYLCGYTQEYKVLNSSVGNAIPTS